MKGANVNKTSGQLLPATDAVVTRPWMLYSLLPCLWKPGAQVYVQQLPPGFQKHLRCHESPYVSPIFLEYFSFTDFQNSLFLFSFVLFAVPAFSFQVSKEDLNLVTAS